MCMKEYGCCLKFRRGDNSTYTFMKRGVVYLWRPLDVCSWLVYLGNVMLSPGHYSISVHFSLVTSPLLNIGQQLYAFIDICR
jgi:hypothetical protein